MAKFEIFKQTQISVPDTLNKNTKQVEVNNADEATAASTAPEKTKVVQEAAHEFVPDYFANVKLQNPDDFLKYEKLCARNYKTVVPDCYVRHFDAVNEEIQNTAEKDWCFKNKNYEITEEKIQELIAHNIQVTPSDYEWVVDHFEKTAIND